MHSAGAFEHLKRQRSAGAGAHFGYDRAMRRVRDKLPLALILLLALAWRLVLWAQPLHQPANDEVEYIQVARDLLAGRGWVFYESWRWLRAPLYPLFLAGSLWLAGADPALTADEVLHRAALPNVLLSVVLVYLIYRLARALTPDGRAGPALIAAAIAALLQTYATFASLWMSETLFSVLFSAGLLALARWHRTGGLGPAALAGMFFGLACLTRSAALIFLPVAAIWMAGASHWGRGQRLRRALAGPLVLAAAAAAVILPWTLRNCQAYGRCILVETGGSYNLWAFYEPRESLDEINRALEAIPNPAERSDEASRRGLARLREDPTILVRKIPAEWTRLWVVKPIQDRFLLASSYSDPPPAIFLAALAFDDLLYLLVLCGAPFGLALALARRDALALLLGLWVGCFAGATLFTHAEGRYRHFLFMALIPLAALAADGLRRGWRPRPGVALAAGGPLALALLPLLLYYPWEWAGSGALRSVYRGVGDTLAAAGRSDGAAQAYLAALQADRTPDGWIALGDLRRGAGAFDEAAKAYERAHETEPTYVGASAVWGDLLRELGHDDAAREAFRGRYLDQRRLAQWGFQMLRPRPVAAIGVGDGLDFGYVGGFYKAEEQQGALTRWTDGRARLRLRPPGEGARMLVRLRAAAPRPDGEPVTLQICAAERCQTVSLGAELRTVQVLLPAADELQLRSATFFGADGRELGVLVDWGEVEGVPAAAADAAWAEARLWYNRSAAARRLANRAYPT